MIDSTYLAVAPHDLYFIPSCVLSNDISLLSCCSSIGIVLLLEHIIFQEIGIQDMYKDDASKICTRNKKSVVTF
jgi:hypothetical protein